MDLLSELEWRGLIKDVTDRPGLEEHLRSGPRRVYAGFDPTADSLTIGNLVPMMMLVHVARSTDARGRHHQPIAVSGGATGLIGDPSGKTAERTLLTPDVVAARVEAQKPIFERVFGHADLATPRLLNNMEWIGKLSWVDALRDIGKHFSVNMMIQKDSVRERLQNRDQGISYTEFSYMLLQAYDFLHLFESHGVTVQMGGSDQYGNIVTGADLIRRMHSREDAAESPTVFGLTAPLVTKADGAKFGKTESGAIWLSAPRDASDISPARTSVYAYYQFWLNALDADVIRYLKIYTLLTRDEIADLERAHAASPGAREAHRALARHATAILHGRAQMEQAEAAARALFSGEIAGLEPMMLAEVLAGAPTSQFDKTRLEGEGVPYIELLVETGLAKSKREAREFLEGGSVQANGRRVGIDDRARTSDLLHGATLALRRGKKTWHVTRWG